LPMPREPPVTNAILPSREKSFEVSIERLLCLNIEMNNTNLPSYSLTDS
jgi:hypothetical protein